MLHEAEAFGNTLSDEADGTATVAPDFSISISTVPTYLQRGETVSLTAIIAGRGSFSSPVTLKVDSELPSWLTLRFTPSTVTPITGRTDWSATISTRLEIETNFNEDASENSKAARSGSAPGKPSVEFRGKNLGLSVAACLLLPVLILRRKAGKLPTLLAVGVMACLPLTSGCGEGRYPDKIDAAAYQIRIRATAESGQEHTVPLFLRVLGS